MLYRIVGEEITTHRHVEISNWDAPDILTAQRNASEIGIIVSTVEPMDFTSEATRFSEAAMDTSCTCDSMMKNNIMCNPEETKESTNDGQALATIIGKSVMFLSILSVFVLWFFCPSKKPAEHYDLVETRCSNSYRVGNTIIDEAPLPEWKRRKIFFDLVAAQDAGVGDMEAYVIVGRKYSIPDKMLLQIAGEGAAKGWPMP